MKKELKIILLITLFLIISAIYFGYIKARRFNNMIVNIDEIKESRSLDDELDIKNLKFNETLLYQDNESTYYYSLVDGYKYAYSPFIKYEGFVNIGFDKEITDGLIEANDTINMIIYNDKSYNIYNIKVTTLPIMNIDVSDDIIKDDYINGSISLYDNSSIKNVKSYDTLIKYRGVTSYTYDKKGYRLSLIDGDKKINKSLLGLRKDDDYILYAAYNDQEKIRNVFSTNLWYECCSNGFGSEYKYLELFINGEYNGLYALGYPIDNKSIEADYLYKKINWVTTDWDITKAKNLDKAGFEVVNDKDEILALNKIKSYYSILLGEDTSKMESIINLPNAVDILLFYNLIQGVDNANEYSLKNTYIAIKDGKILYAPWDLDYTFGNTFAYNGKNTTLPYGNSTKNNTIMKANLAYRVKRMGNSNYNETIRNRYEELRNTYWSDSYISNLIDKYEGYIYNSGAYLRDMEKWPDGNYGNVNLKLSKFKTYVIERLSNLDSYMAKYVGYNVK